MYGRYFRVILGVAVFAWSGGAVRAASFDEPGMSRISNDAGDSYSADPAQSDVVEVPAADESRADDARMEDARLEDTRAPIAWERAEPTCLEQRQAVVGSGRATTVYGTACQRSDGSLLIVPSVAGAAPPPVASTALAQTSLQYCREYQETIVADGRSIAAYGTACWQPDGSWHIVTSPTAAATMPAPVQQAPTYQTSASYWNDPPPSAAAPAVISVYPAASASSYAGGSYMAGASQSVTSTQPSPRPAMAAALSAATAAAIVERVAEARPYAPRSQAAFPRTPVFKAFNARMMTSVARVRAAKAPAISRWVRAPAPKRAAAKRKS